MLFISEEEKYHLRNNLYTACKTGNKTDLKNLLAVFLPSFPLQRILADRLEQSGSKLDDNVDKTVKDSVDKTVKDNVDKTVKDNVDKTVKDNVDKTVKDSIDKTVKDNVDKTIKDNNDVTRKDSELKCDVEGLTVDHLVEINILKLDKQNGADNINVGAGNTSLDTNATLKCDLQINENPEEVSIAKTSVESNVSALFSSKETEKESKVDERTKDLDRENYAKGALSKEPLEFKQNSDKLKPVLEDMSPVVTLDMLSEPFGDNNTTLLHVAAKEGHGAVVTMLMEAGANPTLR